MIFQICFFYKRFIKWFQFFLSFGELFCMKFSGNIYHTLTMTTKETFMQVVLLQIKIAKLMHLQFCWYRYNKHWNFVHCAKACSWALKSFLEINNLKSKRVKLKSKNNGKDLAVIHIITWKLSPPLALKKQNLQVSYPVPKKIDAFVKFVKWFYTICKN